MADVDYEEKYPDRKELVRAVSSYLRGDKKKFYIGITSGPSNDGIAAMRTRHSRYEDENLKGSTV